MTFGLVKASEDVLVRLPVAAVSGQTQHTVTITHAGDSRHGVVLRFSGDCLPERRRCRTSNGIPQTTLATDWDTDHSIAIAPERTAWLMQKLGFCGRANHYAGAMWFYELHRSGHSYASGTLTFSGAAGIRQEDPGIPWTDPDRTLEL